MYLFFTVMQDYLPHDASLRIVLDSFSVTGSIDVGIVDDLRVEQTERFLATLVFPSVERVIFQPTSAQVVIIDDDGKQCT